MRRIIIACLVATAIALAVLAGSAAASGPAAPGKQTVQLTCGSDTFTIAIQKGENSNGAAQIVGQSGHFIGVSFLFTLLDVTTNTVIDSEGPSPVGGGHAHPNQATTNCSIVFFEGTAADFFGTELPPGVAPTDLIRATVAVEAIPKL